MSREANIAAQGHLAEHINAGDVDTAVESFAEDAVDHDPAPGQRPGARGVPHVLQTLAAAFPDAHIEPAHLVADDDNVAIAYTLTGSHQGDFMDRQPDRGPRRPDRPLRERQDRRALGQL